MIERQYGQVENDDDLLTEPNLFSIPFTSQSDNTAVVPQLACGDIVEVFVGRIDTTLCTVDLELVHLGITVHRSSSGEWVSSHLFIQPLSRYKSGDGELTWVYVSVVTLIPVLPALIPLKTYELPFYKSSAR
jgi:hypothetical protein